MLRTGIGIAMLLTAGLAHAEVLDTAAGGFTVRETVDIQAPPAQVYEKFVRNVGDWWDPAHTYSHDSKNLSIDARAEGCFCEKLPEGGGVRHMSLAYVAPGKTVLMTGSMGPLLSLATTGNMTWQFAAGPGGTKMTVTYTVAGYAPGGLAVWGSRVDMVLGIQAARLKSYVETGKPAGGK